MIKIESYSEKDRISFKNRFEEILFDTIKRTVGKAWYKKVSLILGLANSQIYYIKYGKCRLSVGQLKKLITKFPFILDLQIENNIKEIETYEKLRSRLGKAGGSVGGKRILELYPGKLQKQASLGGRATLRKYGKPYFKRLAETSARKGGFAAVKKSAPTEQMKNIINENNRLGLEINKDFFVNHTLIFDKYMKNVDFAYFKNKKLFLVEEATEITPYRKQMYSILLDLLKLRELLPRSIKVLFTFRSQKRGKQNILRIDSSIILEMIKENIIPIVYDGQYGDREKVILDILSKKDISKYIDSLRFSFKKELNERLTKQRSLVNKMLKSKANDTEIILHKKLLHLDLNPSGKIIVKSKYNTYNEVDNSFVINGIKHFVLVTRTKSNLMEVIAGHAKQHVGQAFFLKRFCDANCRVISLILSRKGTIGNSKWSEYLREYATVITSMDELENKISSLSN